MSLFCVMQELCRAFDPVSGNPGMSAPNNLCTHCEQHYARLMKVLVYDYLDLSQLIARRNVHSNDKIRRPKPASTPPIDLHVDEMRSNLAGALLIWEEQVREAARLPMPVNLGAREGWRVHTACKIIGPRVDLLAGLPPIVAEHRGPDHYAYPACGAEALALLAAMHHHIRIMTGVELRSYRLPGECPSCKVTALKRVDGDDKVWCGSCLESWTYTEYQRWVMLMIEENF